MRYDPEVVAVAFERLFRTYRFVEPGEADEMLREYFECLADYETQDIVTGIGNMRSGRAEGFNPSFLPPAPLVAKIVREAMYKRLDSEARTKRATPALPPPDIEKTPESIAKVKAMVEGLIANLAPGENFNPKGKTMQDRLAEHDAYFQPTLNYRTGDPDAEGDMGGSAAA